MLISALFLALTAFQGPRAVPVQFEVVDVTLTEGLTRLSEVSGVPIDFPRTLNGTKIRYTTGEAKKPLGVILEKLFETPGVTPCWYFVRGERIDVRVETLVDFDLKASETWKQNLTRLMKLMGREPQFVTLIGGSPSGSMEYRQISPHLLLRNLLLKVQPPMQFVPQGFDYRIEPATSEYWKEVLANNDAIGPRVVVLGETGREQAGAFSADGQSYFLLTDTRLTQYDAKTGEQLKVIPVLGASTLSISPKGKYVAVGTPSELLLLGQGNLDVIAKVPTVTGNASRVEFSHDDNYYIAWDPFRFAICTSGNPTQPFKEFRKEWEDLKARRVFFAANDPNLTVVETSKEWLCLQTTSLAPKWRFPNGGHELLRVTPQCLEVVSYRNQAVLWDRYFFSGGTDYDTWSWAGRTKPALWFEGDKLVGAIKVAEKSQTYVAQFSKAFKVKQEKARTLYFNPNQTVGVSAALRAPADPQGRTRPPIMRKEVPVDLRVSSSPDWIYLRFQNQVDAFNLKSGQRSSKVAAPVVDDPPQPAFEAQGDRDRVWVTNKSGATIFTLELKDQWKLDETNPEAPRVGVDPNGQWVLINLQNEIRGYAIDDPKKAKWTNPNFAASEIQFSRDGRYAIAVAPEPIQADDRMRIIRLDSHAQIYDGPGQIALIEPGSSRILIAGNRLLKAIDLSGNPIFSGGGSSADRVRQLLVVPGGKHIAGLTDSGVTLLWNGETGAHIVSHISMPGGRSVTYTPDQYYMSSRGAAQILEFVKGDTRMTFDQFDLKLNRPDIVLARLGADPAKVTALFDAYCKRLRILGLIPPRDKEKSDEVNREVARSAMAGLFADYFLPDLSIKGQVASEVSQDSIEIHVTALDRFTNLANLSAYVNGCPVLGQYGLDLSESQKATLDKTIQVPLTPGRNVIKLIVRNQRGGETTRRVVTMCKAQAPKPDLYFFGIGASSYPGNLNNLSADRDVDLLKTYFSKLKGPAFKEVHVETSVAKQVTPTVLDQLRTFVAGAKTYDNVVIFYGGHGLLPQSEADKAVDEYFLGTSIVDLGDLAKTAISFNALKDELAKIPSRQVLVLVDACHAGEQESVDERPPGSGIILPGVQQYRSNSTSPPPNISAAFGLMKELFADMRRGSGAVVLAAAAGNQYAKDTGKSGLFTWCVLQGLQGAADTNADQNVTVEELVTYVGDEVERQSAGGQRPNTRQENLDNDFVVGRTLASLPQPPKAPVKAPAKKPAKKKRGGR